MKPMDGAFNALLGSTAKAVTSKLVGKLLAATRPAKRRRTRQPAGVKRARRSLSAGQKGGARHG